MSVILYCDEELAGFRARLLDGADKATSEAVDQAMLGAAVANRAAYLMTYGETVPTPIDFVDATPSATNPDRAPSDLVGGLFYNCVSNGARDFLPERDRDVLERAAQEADAREADARRAAQEAQIAQCAATTAPPYKGTVERAAEIREALRRRGWTSRRVSVRAELYSMGSTIHVVIKSRDVPLSAVREIAQEHERIDYCQATGEILSGGNRFVRVGYARDVLDAYAAELLAEWPDNGTAATVRGYRVQRDADPDYWWIDHESLDRPRRVCDRRYAAEQLAEMLMG